MIDKRLILDRIKEYYEIHTNAGLARLLNVSPAVVNNWYSRNTIDYDTIIEKCSDSNIEWILTGNGIKPSKKTYPNISDEEFEIFNTILSKIPNHVKIRKPEITALIEYNGVFYKADSIKELDKYLDRIKQNLDFKNVKNITKKLTNYKL